ncbi:MAG: DUF5681 domain-containing protein [Brevundimonas sp.]|uniref:DUF5681 domain-containing protein n=1 Tax=Brevundimonas sp. TaxID=1871086 RepID=UPI00391C8FE1
MTDSGEGEYEVGYGKPPKATRWMKGGRSPNPRGRPKKRPVLERARSTRQIYDDIIAVMEEDVVVRTPKGQKRIPASLALLKKAREDAFKGNGVNNRALQKLYVEAMDFRERERDTIAWEELMALEKKLKRGGMLAEDYEMLNLLRRLVREE